MTKVDVKYNPYFLTTEILVNGNKPKENSDLNYSEGMRLQEWIDSFLPTLKAEYRDSDYSFVYHGTTLDYQDFCSGVDGYKVEHVKSADVEEVERKLHELFKDIQTGPIAELKNLDLTKAFDKVKNGEFEVNVVATMSSGKSTLINAMLAKELMPAANAATTATICKIVDNDASDQNFSLIAVDDNGEVAEKSPNATYDDMVRLNKDENIPYIELRGNIPFVKGSDIKLALVDTPGPNNARNKKHCETTYNMFNNSDKSLVLYIMNGTQLETTDDEAFLSYISEEMKKNGKQSRDRFLFVINKLDSFSGKKDATGIGCIKQPLANASQRLKEKGIENANIFPLAALVALQKRVGVSEYDEDEKFTTFIKKYNNPANKDEFKFEKHTDFTHLALESRERIEKRLAEGDELDEVLIHSGIVPIEEAICQYINKYAKTTKIKDLVSTFKGSLDGLNEIAKIQSAIASGEEAQKGYQKQLENINSVLKNGEIARSFANDIDNQDLVKAPKKEIQDFVTKLIGDFDDKFRSIASKTKVPEDEAKNYCKQFENLAAEYGVQTQTKLNDVISQSYKSALNQIVSQYKKVLTGVEFTGTNSNFQINTLNIVSNKIAGLNNLIKSNTKSVDESYYTSRQETYTDYEERDVEKTRRVFVPSKRHWYNPFSWFKEGDHYETRSYWTTERVPVTKTRTVQDKVTKYVNYVDISKVFTNFLALYQKEMFSNRQAAIEFMENESKRLKDFLKNQIAEINKVLEEKVNSLQDIANQQKLTASEIEENRKNLVWLESIEKRLNAILNVD